MENISQSLNFLIVTIIPHGVSDEEALKELKEVKSLIEAYGGVVKDLVVQRREVHDKGMYIGKGKIDEVAQVVKNQKINVVVLNALVNSGHIHVIKRVVEKQNPHVHIWDRADLILEIFAKHAHTAEAKLQIELASMRHMGPRIYGMGYVLSRQGGGIGTIGVGETNTELMKRHWRDQMKKVQDKLKKLTEDRQRQLQRRIKNGIQTVSIIGYTNAGKTSLFNRLTGKRNEVENALFVTLDSSTGKVFLPHSKKEILVSDTIGFIRNLPPNLIDAFKSTLLESIHADLLMLVIDISDDDMDEKIETVEEILYELGLERKERLYVFNKIDLLITERQKDISENYKEFYPQYISVKKEIGTEKLLSTIEMKLKKILTKDDIPLTERRIKRIHF